MPKQELTAEDAQKLIDAERDERARRALELIRATLEKERCELHYQQMFVDGVLVRAEWAVVPK